MSLKEPPEFEGTDLELPSDAGKIGVDGNGATHYHSSYHNEVFVAEPDGSTATFDLDNTPCGVLSEWIGHVESQRGQWKEMLYHDGEPFEYLLEELEKLA